MIKATLLLAACALAGCAERDQAANGISSDVHASVGTDRPQPFMASGWKAGDRASWEQHMKVRTQGGQNEYARID